MSKPRKTNAASARKHKYRSKFEAKVAAELQKSKTFFLYEKVKVKYSLHLECTYTPDFSLKKAQLIETKGRFTSNDRRKHLAIKAQHPDLDIRFVFMRNNTLSKVSKTKYSDWCDKHNFKWAIGSVPKEWLDE